MANPESNQPEPKEPNAPQAGDPPKEPPKPSDMPQATDPPQPESAGQSDDPTELPDLQEWKRTQKALRQANKEAEANRLKIKEYEDAQKSELDKANERAAELEKTATQAQAEALRYRIAAKNEISDEDAEIFLTGTDEETLAKQAERLVALRGEQASPRAPKPDPSQGSRGPVDLDSQIAEAEKKGDVRASIRLKQEKAAASRAAAHTR